MNVACTACPAKYAVPDDRVRGKRARITCKHCGTSIIVDGTSLGPSENSQAGARPARPTMVGIGAAGNSQSRISSPAASLQGGAWLVALNDGRREPASLARVIDLYASGSIDASTYVWREGMQEWKTPFEIPEIQAALAARGLSPARPSEVPPASARTGFDGQDEATQVAVSVQHILNSRANGSASGSARSPSNRPGRSEDSVTVARSGPPSTRIGLSGAAPRRNTPQPSGPAASGPYAAAQRLMPPHTSPSDAPRRPTLPPLSSVPAPSRPRSMSLIDDFVIPLTGPGAPPPAPRPQSMTGDQQIAAAALQAAAAARPQTIPPGSSGSGLLVPPSVASARPPPPPPPPMAQAVPAYAGANLGTPSSRQPYEFEMVPRSAAPVAVALDNPFSAHRRRRRTAVVFGVLTLTIAGVGGALYAKSRRATVPAPTAVAVAPVARPAETQLEPKPEPTPAETAAPSASTSASAAPASEPEPEAAHAAPARTTASTPVTARAPSAHRDDSTRTAARATSKTSSDDEEESTAADTSSSTSNPGSSPSPSASASASAATPSAPSTSSDDSPALAALKAEMQHAAAAAGDGPAGTAPFDRDAAAQALAAVAGRAGSCKSVGGPTGTAPATVTFAPSGRVTAASIGGDFEGTLTGACIAKLFRSATVPAFSGEAVTVTKRVTLE